MPQPLRASAVAVVGRALRSLVAAFATALCYCIFVVSVQPKHVFIDNKAPKLDIGGNIVNGHDGTYRFLDGAWYYHAAEYGLCREPPRRGCDQTPDHCGFRNDHNVSVWRSPDLSSGSWARVATAVQCTELPNCRAKVLKYKRYSSGNYTAQTTCHIFPSQPWGLQ